jgi:hypothetical protein
MSLDTQQSAAKHMLCFAGFCVLSVYYLCSICVLSVFKYTKKTQMIH